MRVNLLNLPKETRSRIGVFVVICLSLVVFSFGVGRAVFTILTLNSDDLEYIDTIGLTASMAGHSGRSGAPLSEPSADLKDEFDAVSMPSLQSPLDYVGYADSLAVSLSPLQVIQAMSLRDPFLPPQYLDETQPRAASVSAQAGASSTSPPVEASTADSVLRRSERQSTEDDLDQQFPEEPERAINYGARFKSVSSISRVAEPPSPDSHYPKSAAAGTADFSAAKSDTDLLAVDRPVAGSVVLQPASGLPDAFAVERRALPAELKLAVAPALPAPAAVQDSEAASIDGVAEGNQRANRVAGLPTRTGVADQIVGAAEPVGGSDATAAGVRFAKGAYTNVAADQSAEGSKSPALVAGGAKEVTAVQKPALKLLQKLTVPVVADSVSRTGPPVVEMAPPVWPAITVTGVVIADQGLSCATMRVDGQLKVVLPGQKVGELEVLSIGLDYVELGLGGEIRRYTIGDGKVD